MFTAHIDDSRIRQDELRRQAADYRLIRSLTTHRTPAQELTRIFRSLISSLLLP